jgi:hypothetical protein
MVVAIASANSSTMQATSDPYDKLQAELVEAGETHGTATCVKYLLKMNGVPDMKIAFLVKNIHGQNLIRELYKQASSVMNICMMDTWVFVMALFVLGTLTFFILIGFVCCCRWMIKCKKHESASVTAQSSRKSMAKRNRDDSLELNRKKKLNLASPSAYV